MPEQGEHCEHTAVVVLGGGEVELLEDRLHVPLDRAPAQVELLGDCAVRAALGDQREHLALALGELVEGGAPVAADEALDDVRVEGRSAVGNTLDRADELRHVAHTVFEQVADARGVVADELEHVGGLEVLGENEHGDGGVAASDLRGCDEPVVRVPWRHLHVDDRDVGRVGADLQQEVVGIA